MGGVRWGGEVGGVRWGGEVGGVRWVWRGCASYVFEGMG
jgi:hypothetical protein